MGFGFLTGYEDSYWAADFHGLGRIIADFFSGAADLADAADFRVFLFGSLIGRGRCPSNTYQSMTIIELRVNSIRLFSLISE